MGIFFYIGLSLFGQGKKINLDKNNRFILIHLMLLPNQSNPLCL